MSVGNTSKIKHRRRRRAARAATKVTAAELAADGYVSIGRHGKSEFWHKPHLDPNVDEAYPRTDPGPVTLALGARLFGRDA